MGIFFDQDWFDARLRAVGADRPGLARAAGMTLDELDLVFRDLRELAPGETRAFAEVLMSSPAEVAERAGLPDPEAFPQSLRRDEEEEAEFRVTREVIAGLHERLDRIELMLERVMELVRTRPGSAGARR